MPGKIDVAVKSRPPTHIREHDKTGARVHAAAPRSHSCFPPFTPDAAPENYDRLFVFGRSENDFATTRRRRRRQPIAAAAAQNVCPEIMMHTMTRVLVMCQLPGIR